CQRARVARREQRRQDGRVDETTRKLVRAKALAKKRLEQRADLGPCAGRRIEPRELRGGGEARETVVHLVNPRLALGQPLRGETDRVDLALAPERLEEPPLDRHRRRAAT